MIRYDCHCELPITLEVAGCLHTYLYVLMHYSQDWVTRLRRSGPEMTNLIYNGTRPYWSKD